MADHPVKNLWTVLLLPMTIGLTGHADTQEKTSWSWAQPVSDHDASSDSFPLNIEFKDQVSITSADIFLSDLIICKNPDESCDSTRHFFIGKAPRPGHKKTILTRSVIDQLKSEWADLNLKTEGPDKITVISEGEPVTNQEIESFLSELLQSVNARFSNLKFSAKIPARESPWIVSRGIRNISFPEFKNSHQMSRSRLIELIRHKRNLKVEVNPADHLERKLERLIPVIFSTKLKSLVAHQDLPRNHPVQKNDLAEEWIELTDRENQFLTEFQGDQSLTLRRDIAAGTPLKKSDLTKNIIVKRGQIMTMHMTESGLEVKVQVKTKEPGSLGDIIQTVYEPTKKILSGKIISANSITFTSGEFR